jgi:beta-carotene ketolase (CrtW type)
MNLSPDPRTAVGRHQLLVGLALAGGIAAAWLTLHVYAVFFHALAGAGLLAAPLLVAMVCWLNVGLFITAHDAMHGSLAPGRPRLNRIVGRIALGLYAGFAYGRLTPKHHLHHRHAGTHEDPDFSATHPTRFWPWYLAFFRAYFGWREFGILTILLLTYLLVLGASPVNTLLFWGLPAILSSLQLFYFGTFLPHRHGSDAFGDHHNARSNGYRPLVSLLTWVPWWRLPAERARSR